MRAAYAISTGIFLLTAAGFWVASLLTPATSPSAAAADRLFTLAEVARHDRAQDCWMVIAEVVYDFTSYLPQHPSDPAIVTPWCGKEATEAYRTKTKGRAHSAYADGLLPKYRIGKLQ
jgi:cytochrome b involved in lipid metabolism